MPQRWQVLRHQHPAHQEGGLSGVLMLLELLGILMRELRQQRFAGCLQSDRFLRGLHEVPQQGGPLCHQYPAHQEEIAVQA